MTRSSRAWPLWLMSAICIGFNFIGEIILPDVPGTVALGFLFNAAVFFVGVTLYAGIAVGVSSREALHTLLSHDGRDWGLMLVAYIGIAVVLSMIGWLFHLFGTLTGLAGSLDAPAVVSVYSAVALLHALKLAVVDFMLSMLPLTPILALVFTLVVLDHRLKTAFLLALKFSGRNMFYVQVFPLFILALMALTLVLSILPFPVAVLASLAFTLIVPLLISGLIYLMVREAFSDLLHDPITSTLTDPYSDSEIQDNTVQEV